MMLTTTAVSCKNKSSAVTEMGEPLTTTDMDRKVGDCYARFGAGELGSPLTQCGLV